MRKIIGIFLIIIGVLFGLYVGLWQMFICGILAIAKSIDSGNVTAIFVAVNIIKILLATPIGGFIFWILSTIGFLVIEA